MYHRIFKYSKIDWFLSWDSLFVMMGLLFEYSQIQCQSNLNNYANYGIGERVGVYYLYGEFSTEYPGTPP